ncbi:MAG: PQQ-binding-like beta-propeller repeat protein, partial [Novosphingobium sp.]
MKRRFSTVLAGLAAATVLSAAPAVAGGPTSADIINDAATPSDVISYGMGPQQQRFSSLDKLNTSNVKNLVPVFAASLGGEKQRGQESQPLVYDGTIYVTGSYSRLFAFDARTGEKKWEYNARLPEGIMPCCDVV